MPKKLEISYLGNIIALLVEQKVKNGGLNLKRGKTDRRTCKPTKKHARQ